MTPLLIEQMGIRIDPRLDFSLQRRLQQSSSSFPRDFTDPLDRLIDGWRVRLKLDGFVVGLLCSTSACPQELIPASATMSQPHVLGAGARSSSLSHGKSKWRSDHEPQRLSSARMDSISSATEVKAFKTSG